MKRYFCQRLRWYLAALVLTAGSLVLVGSVNAPEPSRPKLPEVYRIELAGDENFWKGQLDTLHEKLSALLVSHPDPLISHDLFDDWQNDRLRINIFPTATTRGGRKINAGGLLTITRDPSQFSGYQEELGLRLHDLVVADRRQPSTVYVIWTSILHEYIHALQFRRAVEEGDTDCILTMLEEQPDPLVRCRCIWPLELEAYTDSLHQIRGWGLTKDDYSMLQYLDTAAFPYRVGMEVNSFEPGCPEILGKFP